MPDNTESAAPSTVRADRILDVKGLDCPLPIVRTKRALGELRPGQIIHVLATDPHSVVDFQAFCVRTGHELVHMIRGPQIYEFYVRRKGGP